MTEVARLIEPFPEAGRRVETAYRHLELACQSMRGQAEVLLDTKPARPWDPSTCEDPNLRLELWHWLDRAASWLNHQHAIDPADVIPPCWPRHPRLVVELALLVDRRRAAGRAPMGDLLVQWQGIALPTFHDRLRRTVGFECQRKHEPIASSARASDFDTDRHVRARLEMFHADCDGL